MFSNRSQGIRTLLRDFLVKNERISGKKIAGVITLVYNHTKSDLIKKLISTQHDFHHIILSTQHIHLDHLNCLEIIVVEGRTQNIEKLFILLKSVKGIKHSTLTITTTGKNIP